MRAPYLRILALDLCFSISSLGLVSLEALSSLRFLSLEGCDCVDDTKLAFLLHMPKLESLSLDMCSELRSGLENLAQMKREPADRDRPCYLAVGP